MLGKFSREFDVHHDAHHLNNFTVHSIGHIISFVLYLLPLFSASHWTYRFLRVKILRWGAVSLAILVS